MWRFSYTLNTRCHLWTLDLFEYSHISGQFLTEPLVWRINAMILANSAWSGQVFQGPVSLTVSLALYSFLSLLRARPVMSVSVQLSFSPNEISLIDFECPGEEFNAFNLTSCLTVAERTSSSGNVNDISKSLSHMKSMASMSYLLMSLRISQEEPECFSEPECGCDERNQSRILRSEWFVIQDSAAVRPAEFWDLLFQLPHLHEGTFRPSQIQTIMAASVWQQMLCLF